MDKTRSRLQVAGLISLPMSVMLAVLFFMPWLELACDPKAVLASPQQTVLPPGIQVTEPKTIAHASGWDLARGKLTPADEFKHHADPASDQPKAPDDRPWVYACLVLPVLLALCGLMCVAGASPVAAGRGMLLLGVAGVILMLVAASVDYVDDMVAAAGDQASSAGACKKVFDSALTQAVPKMKEVFRTDTTWCLWGSVVLYSIVAGCGMAVLTAPRARMFAVEPAARLSARRAASQSERPSPTGWPQPAKPAGTPSERRQGGLPMFGEEIRSAGGD